MISSSSQETGLPARAVLERVTTEFPDLPMEAVVKEDCLRRGVWFTPEALEAGADFARKSYFIFSFDRLPPTEMEAAIQRAAPEERRGGFIRKVAR